MRVDRNTLRKIAHLSRLEINLEEEEGLLRDLTEILDWMEKLDEVDTKGIKPLTNMSYEVNVFRDDVAGKPLEKERGLHNAPRTNFDFFIVPKVIE